MTRPRCLIIGCRRRCKRGKAVCSRHWKTQQARKDIIADAIKRNRRPW